MGQRSRSNDAATKDALTMLRREECASDMGHSRNDAAVKDVLIELRREECARGTEQRSNYAASKDVQINPNVEDYVGGMKQAVLLTMAPLLLDQNTRRLLRLQPCLIRALLMRQTKEVLVFLER